MPAPSLRDDPPVALAKHAIALLEAHIREQYGLKLHMGAELEFAVKADPASLDDHEQPYGLQRSLDAKKRGRNHTASAARPPALRDGFFPDSRRVTFCYLEEQVDTQWDVLEAVLTHRPAEADGTPIARDAQGLAREIEALRGQLRQPAHGYLDPQNTPTSVADAQRIRAGLLDYCDQPSLPGYLSHPITCGLHLNTSLTDRRGRDPFSYNRFLDEHGTAITPLSFLLAHQTQRIFHDHLYLLGESPEAQNRYSRRATHPYELLVKPKENSFSYLENRICANNANPYYAVMLQLAGIAQGLALSGLPDGAISEDAYKHYMQESRALAFTSPRTLPAQGLRKRFENATGLRELLDQLEPGLGDRFYAQIARHPPGTERSVMTKLQEDRRGEVRSR